MLHKIVVVNGIARSGKDTFVTLCDRYWRSKRHSFCIMHSTVGFIKEMLEEYYDIPEEPKTDKKRTLWCEIKRLLTEYDDCSFKAIKKLVYEVDCLSNGQHLLFVMAREPKEIEKIKAEWPNKAITVLVSRAVHDIPSNSADREVWNYVYDYTVDNNGSLDDLNREAIKFYEYITKE